MTTPHQQLDLRYRPATIGREAYLAQLEAIRAAVQHLGHKDVAYELDIAGSYLSDALNERDRKRWASEWTLVVLAMLEQRRDGVADEIARRILEPAAALSTYVLEDRVELDNAALLHAIGKTPEGKAAIEAAQRKGRKR